MLIERPPRLYRMLFPGAVWRIETVTDHANSPKVYLTFDDGPVPEVTPWVLDRLDEYGIKASFFMVGDNVRKYPWLYNDVVARGHAVGNHTMHHLQGLQTSVNGYLKDVADADNLIHSPLFRPPHGMLRRAQLRRLLEQQYKLIMYDLVTRDYSCRLTADEVKANVIRHTRPGSIIVFHDSIKSWPRLQNALPQSIEWLMSKGYGFETISMD